MHNKGKTGGVGGHWGAVEGRVNIRKPHNNINMLKVEGEKKDRAIGGKVLIKHRGGTNKKAPVQNKGKKGGL